MEKKYRMFINVICRVEKVSNNDKVAADMQAREEEAEEYHENK